jgi:predicted Zn-ribbon and HTH transcriptional regulator
MSTGTNSVYLVRHTGDPNVEFEIIDSNHQSWDRLSKLITERPADVLACSYNVRIIQRGMWFPSNELAKREVVITSMMADESMNNFAPGELSRARKAYLAWLASPAGGNAPKEAALVENGDTLEHRMVYAAILKNAGTVVAAILLLISLRGMPEYLRVWRAGRRMKKGRCGVCKYDLSATEAINGEKRCPECGAVWHTR